MRFWPTDPPTFKETIDKYSLTLKEVSASLLRSMSESLGLESEYLINVFEDQTQMIRFNYYPPCPEANRVIGLSSHSDATGLTFLLQANNVSGLQVKKNGKWLTVEPLQGAFIVNVGDLVEIFTNGRYKSVEHRAMVNPENARVSIAAFNAPARDIIG
ncbi:protein SRG1-like, partial [Asparagus officinalis]|uniref:protein SRG1-like n=1 Tax=Asparagus officinalis TaxID=4686 RepID=UPI00098E5691